MTPAPRSQRGEPHRDDASGGDPTASPARSLPLVVLALILAIVVIQVPIIAGGRTWEDLRYHTEVAPPRLAASAAILDATLPAWWEGSGLGVPLAGEPSHGAMYPPAWLAIGPHALDLVAIAHLVWAAVGIAIWARRRAVRWTPHGASEPGALVAGLLVVSSGLVASIAVRGALPALAHLPWVGLAASLLVDAGERRRTSEDSSTVASGSIGDGATRDARTRAAIGLALALGAIALAGVLALFVDAVILAIAIGARRRTLPWLAGAVAIGAAIGFAQWWPALQLLVGGEYAGAPDLHGLPLSRLVELIVPGSFGASDAERAVAAIAGSNAWAPSLFVGAPLLALAAAARPPPLRSTMAIVALSALALVAGRGGWPAWLGAPELHLGVLVVMLAPHAAAGFDALVAGDRRALLSLATGAACAGVALGAVFAQRARDPDIARAIERSLVDGGLGLVCMIGALVLAWRASRTITRGGSGNSGNGSSDPARTLSRGATALVLGLLVLPTVGATPSIAPRMDRSAVVDPPPFASAALERPAASAAPLRVYRPHFMFAFEQDRRTTETADDALATFAGASAWRWGIAAARSEDPARLPVHDRFWLAAANEGGALLDRFGISLAILPETLVVPRGFTALATRGAWTLVRLPVAPAASVVHGSLWNLDPDETMHLMFPGGGGTGILPGTVVLTGRGEPRAHRGAPRECNIERWDAGAIDVSCTAEAPGYAVVSSSASSGWEVSVDGEPMSWLAADVLRRAVEIPAGTHRIEWRYRAPGLVTGLLVAFAGLLVLVGVALTMRLGRKAATAKHDDATN